MTELIQKLIDEKKEKMKNMKAISLFSGMGGDSLGIHNCDIQLVGYSEIDVVVTEKQLTDMTRHKNEVLAGATVGLGVRGEWLGFNTKTAIEYTDFDEYKSTVSTSLSGTKTITADLDVTQVKFSMGKQF